MRHELIQFHKRTFIQQHVDTFSGCHTPRLMLLIDTDCAATQGSRLVQFFKLLIYLFFLHFLPD